jgi:DMSO/TMAO reductase YedYZ molybdopterin-dependent catalytic subunit
MITRGFTGRRQTPDLAKRLPPGQSLTEDFPVLSAGPTPHISAEDCSFTLKLGPRPIAKWNWAEFNALPKTRQTRDIHCVTKWSKLDTPWEGVLIDDILAAASLANVPLADLVSGKPWSRSTMRGSRFRPTMAGRPDCWCRISISGSRRNG